MKIAGNLIVVFSLSMVLMACSNPARSGQNQEIVVRVAQVVQQPGTQQKEFSFISAPFRTSELSFRVGGPVDYFEGYTGNFYKRGEVIAEIDPRDFRIRKERTEAIYKQAKAEFQRIETLYRKNNLSASTFEKAKADYVSAKTAYETAVNELKDTRLLAPFDGYIGEVYIEKFQDVKPAQPVISFIDINRLKIETYVTQEIAFNRPEGREVDLRFDAMPGKVYKASITEISKNTTSNNLSYLLTALLPNEGVQLPAGMSGKLSFQLDSGRDGMAIDVPQKAVCHCPAVGDYVWTFDPESQKVVRKKVTLGRLMPGGQVNVVEGLSGDEWVVVTGLRFLSEGMNVKIADDNRI